MPIRPEYRHLYRTAEWKQARERVLIRAGAMFDENGKYSFPAKCEQCGKPDRTRVETRFATAEVFGPRMWWRAVSCGWRNHLGEEQTPPRYYDKERFVTVILTVAHLDHTPGHDDDSNLKALCQWCHLNFDKLHHAETRKTRKDRSRPLLVTCP